MSVSVAAFIAMIALLVVSVCSSGDSYKGGLSEQAFDGFVVVFVLSVCVFIIRLIMPSEFSTDLIWKATLASLAILVTHSMIDQYVQDRNKAG